MVKAVGEPNLREFPVTLALAATHSEVRSAILATRRAWNGWLAPEIEGTKPRRDPEHHAVEDRSGISARLQIESIGKQFSSSRFEAPGT